MPCDHSLVVQQERRGPDGAVDHFDRVGVVAGIMREPADVGDDEGDAFFAAPGAAGAEPRTVEPRARPAATRGLKPCPQPDNTITKTDPGIESEHKVGNTPEHPKNLKYLVLGMNQSS